MRRIRARLASQAGLTLPELIIAMAMLAGVLGATLDTLDNFVRTTKVNERQNDAQDRARFTMDRLARELRNLASPTNANVKSIDKATDYDLVFQTVDEKKRRVRYCLDSSTPTNGVLWSQTQAFTVDQTDPGLPSTASCPASGWTTQGQVAANITNVRNSLDRPIFFYGGLGADGDTAKVTSIRASIFLDTKPNKPPKEASLASGDFLRNQNQPPVVPDFTLLQTPAGSRNVLLNASDAVDPEGRTLDYFWYKGTGSTASLPDCLTDATQTGGGFTCLGRGLTYSYSFPTTTHGVQTITLKVVDPGNLSAVLQKTTTSLP